jgi:hypothetical protein
VDGVASKLVPIGAPDVDEQRERPQRRRAVKPRTTSDGADRDHGVPATTVTPRAPRRMLGIDVDRHLRRDRVEQPRRGAAVHRSRAIDR